MYKLLRIFNSAPPEIMAKGTLLKEPVVGEKCMVGGHPNLPCYLTGTITKVEIFPYEKEMTHVYVDKQHFVLMRDQDV